MAEEFDPHLAPQSGRGTPRSLNRARGCIFAEGGTGGDPMYPYKPIGHAVGRVVAICFAVAGLAIGLPNGALAAAPKAGNPAASAKSEATPEKIQQLMTLLADPKVRDWLEQESKSQASSEQAATEESVSQALDARLAAMREHIVDLARTVPDLPAQYERGHDLVTADLGEHGRTKALLLLAVFVGLGTGVEWLFRKATQRARAHLDTL